MRTINKNESAEIVIKKSKFIANIFRVNSEEEAKKTLNEVSKKYFDAKHNCYAYVIQEIENLDEKESINLTSEEKNKEPNERKTELKDYRIETKEKFSDNGEPQGTAGSPILEIIKKKELYNVIIIVTRYFGGILLGTGGLTRAYSEAAKEAIEKCEIVEKNFGDEYAISTNYQNQKDLIYELKKSEIVILKQEYSEDVKIYIDVPKEKEGILNNMLRILEEQNKIKVKEEKIKENILI